MFALQPGGTALQFIHVEGRQAMQCVVKTARRAAGWHWKVASRRVHSRGTAPADPAPLVLQNIVMPHQWVEGNLPVSAKCFVCDKTCGSVLR